MVNNFCRVLVAGGLAAACGPLGSAADGPGDPPAEPVWTAARVLGTSGFHHTGSMSGIAVLPDGRRVISCSRDGTARMWDLASGDELRRFHVDPPRDVWGVLPLPGGDELLTAGAEGAVTRWDLRTGEAIMTYPHETTVFRVALRPGGGEFVATDNKNLAVLWEIGTGKKVQTFRGHTKAVYTAVFVSGGKRLLTGGKDGKLKVWDPDTGDCLETSGEEFDDVYTMALSPDGNRIAMACGDDAVRVVDAETLKVSWKHDLPDDTNVVAWSPDGGRVAVACEDKRLYLLEAGNGNLVKSIEVPGGHHIPVAFSVDGRELISGGDRMLYRWNVESGERILPAAGDPLVRGGVRLLAISGDGREVFATGEGGSVQVWNTVSGAPARRLEAGFEIKGMAASPDGRHLAVGGDDGRIVVMDTADGRIVSQPGGEGRVNCLLFTPDGARLVTAGSDHKARVWRVPDAAPLLCLEGHDDDINAVAVSADGDTLVTTSDDKTVRLWDLEAGKEVRAFTAGDEEFFGIACLADGQSFLVAPRGPDVRGLLVAPKGDTALLPPERIAALLEQLGADEYARREEATDLLTKQGRGILPLLEDAPREDPEAAHRLKRIRSAIRHGTFRGELREIRKFGGTVRDFRADPSGRFWAATVGSRAHARVVAGDVHGEEMRVLFDHADGHGPGQLAFSGDGSILVTGNRDGSVSVFHMDAAGAP